MQGLLLGFYFVSITIFILYFVGLIVLRNAFQKFITTENPIQYTQEKISLIICFRNEEAFLPKLLESINNLDYPTHLFEVIIIDDHSTDQSRSIVQHWLENSSISNITLLVAEQHHHGKKVNLKRAVQHSNNKILVSTDADCILPVDYLNQVSRSFANKDLQLLCLPIKIHHNDSFISKFESLDFLFINTITATFNYLHSPILCNGAALACRKDTYEKYLSSTFYDEKIASGDDMFLLNFVLDQMGESAIQFANSFATGITLTKASMSMHEFVQQRMRWIKKSGSLKLGKLSALGSSIAFVNYLCVALLILILTQSNCAIFVALFCMLLKFLGEFTLYQQARKTYAIQHTNTIFLMAFFIYPIMTFYITMLSVLKVKFDWKGRSYRR